MTTPERPVPVQKSGLYIHFPYCARICPYCDFNVAVGRFDSDKFADAILREFEARFQAWNSQEKLQSIYIGGGTPSLWAPEVIERVISGITSVWPTVEGAERTLEANPESAVDPADFAAAGITRLSIGAQSYRQPELVRLGRCHEARQVDDIVARAQEAGLSTSLDLIFGTPGQTESDLEASVSATLVACPDHISGYALTIETGTFFGRQTAKGRFHPMADDDQAELGRRFAALVGAGGYRRYEVSSYAPSGAEAVHNGLYWRGNPYLGLGPGAHSYRPAADLSSALRRENQRDVGAYLAAAEAGRFEAEFEETLTRNQAVAERLIVGARTIFGVDLDTLGAISGVDLNGALAKTIAAQVERGWVETRGSEIAATEEGLNFADTLARDWWIAADRVLNCD